MTDKPLTTTARAGALDTSVPHSARLWNYLLGGKDNFAADREGTVNGRGADPKTRFGGQVAVKRQPGTAPAGQTGTVPPQGRTADHTLSSAS